ncbi:EAL domain-containing protein (plasmid) [Phyllobacterium sp. 628]|uniref:EAL domain-containing protein n=1 Tax=Phyllobacterium sp. 628 TaxID=2718938 RepID=UPI0016624802|nr:EAL domain-containing protein [Phyllobacterium sp. 628]QND55001.1 EAL domain-containing protein [Phyllobacterium sp. 628]
MHALSSQLLKRAEAVFNEADVILSKVNASDMTFCSDKELAYLRNVLFTTKYLKDIGRVKDGKFYCSAVFGAAEQPAPLAQPNITTVNGALIYADTPLAISNLSAPIIGRGNANVVLDPAAFDAFNDPAYPFGIMFSPSDEQNPIGIFGSIHKGVQTNGLTENAGREGDIVYRNQCHGQACVSLHAHVQDLEAAAFPIEASIALLGGALGGALGVILLLLLRKRLSLGTRLSRALDKRLLKVEYQPIIHLQTGETRSAEALVRWRDGKEVISPDIFIAVAEKEGLIGRLTLYVIDRVLLEMGDFLKKYPDFRININISADDLMDPRFSSLLAARLKQAGVRSQQVGLEITERSTANAGPAVQAIHQLRSQGHKIYIDDFGTGYSSLAYLGELNVDGIKLDKSFTQTVGTRSITVSIVPQIIDMALAHNLAIVVEGIETSQQQDYFATLDTSVDGQGWLCGKPADAAALQKLVV